MTDIILRTVLPIVLLISLGYLSRHIKVLKQGDERVFSAYVYYFALPAFFLANISGLSITREVFGFIASAVLPTFVALAAYLAAFIIFRFNRGFLFKLILSTIFGSYAFFGIPFILFAFPGDQGERLAALSSSVMAMASVAVSITLLEVYKHRSEKIVRAAGKVAKSLFKNPLILSVVAAFVLSFLNAQLPKPLDSTLHMLGNTTSTVAIFMLGVFLYGRRYEHLAEGFLLALPRIFILPLIAVLSAWLFGIQGLERTVIVMMSAMPVAISSIVLSERYDFYKETIASLILFSSLGAIIYLPVWLLIIGTR